MATTLYYLVVPSGSTAPTAAQIVAGVDYGSVTVLDAGSVAYTAAGTYDADSAPVTGAAASTAYDQWWVAYDGTDYGSPVSGEITTAAGAIAGASSGTISTTGSAAATLAIAGASTGTFAIAGSAESALAIGASSTGQIVLTGSGAATITDPGDIAAASNATISVSGSATAALGISASSARSIDIGGNGQAIVGDGSGALAGGGIWVGRTPFQRTRYVVRRGRELLVFASKEQAEAVQRAVDAAADAARRGLAKASSKPARRAQVKAAQPTREAQQLDSLLRQSPPVEQVDLRQAQQLAETYHQRQAMDEALRLRDYEAAVRLWQELRDEDDDVAAAIKHSQDAQDVELAQVCRLMRELMSFRAALMGAPA